MRKKLAAALLAAFLLSAGAARADNLYISGLGTLPFDRDIAVTDGAGTAVEGMIRRQASAPQERNTKRNRLMRFLTVPGGMTLADGTAHSPAAGARLWQLVKKETHGTYTMLAVAFSGDGDELFPKGGQKARERLETVFRTGRLPAEEKDRVLISLDEFRDAAAKAVAGGKGPAPDFRIIDAVPWKVYNNDDGTVRWQQSVKFTIIGEDGLVVPMWMESVLYRNSGGRYYFLIFTGGHESGRQMEDEILYALYRLEREKV